MSQSRTSRERFAKLTDAIERGDYGRITGAAVPLDAPAMPFLGFGDVPPVDATEFLACTHYKMIRARLIGVDALDL